MVVLRQGSDSNPNIEVLDDERAAGSTVTVHFEARPPNAARRVEPEAQSVVVVQLGKNLGAAAETTHVTRPRGLARWLSPKLWLISVENHWVFLAVGLAVAALLFCTARLRGY